MKDTAYKVIALHSLLHTAIQGDEDPDVVFDIELDLQETAVELAEAVALADPHKGMNMPGVLEYMQREEVCFQHAVVELVNAGIAAIKSEEEKV